MECQFCKKILSTISSLNQHQKTVKSCLKLQGEDIKGNYVCDFCKNDYQKKSYLNIHQNTCKFKRNKDKDEDVNNLKRELEVLKSYKKNKDEEIEVLKREMKVLKRDKKYKQEEMKVLKRENEILSKDKQELKNDLINSLLNSNNNITQNNITQNNISIFLEKAEPITEAYIKDNIEKMTLDKHVTGFIGYSIVIDLILKDRFICTDYARKKFKYKNEDKIIIEEIGLGELFKRIFSIFCEICRELTEKHREKLSIIFSDEEISNYDFNRVYNDLRKSADGIETIIGNKIIDCICKKNTVGQMMIR